MLQKGIYKERKTVSSLTKKVLTKKNFYKCICIFFSARCHSIWQQCNSTMAQIFFHVRDSRMICSLYTDHYNYVTCYFFHKTCIFKEYSTKSHHYTQLISFSEIFFQIHQLPIFMPLFCLILPMDKSCTHAR